MTLITMPSAGIKSIAWTPPAWAGWAVESGWTGGQTAGDLGGPLAGWKAKVTIVPGDLVLTQAWRSFFAKLHGPVNTFGVKAVELPQTTAAGVTVDGAGQTGQVLNLAGLPASATVLPDGALLQVYGTLADWQLFTLVAPLVSNGAGKAAAQLGTPIRKSYANAALAFLASPAAQMRMISAAPPLTAVPGYYDGFSFDCMEAY